VFIATRHDSHGDYVLQALRGGKHVFVEKPLCLTITELLEIREAYAESVQLEPRQLMVGLNRRFSPHVTLIKSKLSDAPVAMTCRVNAGAVPAESWIQDSQLGGGRIIGEGCHFIDLMTSLCGSLPTRVRATAIPDPQQLQDTVSIQVEFANGSIGTLHYFANGSQQLPKEHVEVFQSGCVYTVQDFRRATIYSNGKLEHNKTKSQNKGQAEMVAQLLGRIKTGGPPLIPFAEIDAVMAACFAATESLKTGMPVGIVG
jgi:polar amino acid transport system substrate-binding protein